MSAKKPRLSVVGVWSKRPVEANTLEQQRDQIYLAQAIITLASHSHEAAPDWALEMGMDHAFDILGKVTESLDHLQLKLSNRGAA